MKCKCKDAERVFVINLPMLTGYLASILYILLLATGIYLFGYAARRANALYVTFLEIVSACFIVTLIVLFIDRLSVADLFFKPSKENWLWLGAASVTGFVGGNFFAVTNIKSAGERTNSLLSAAITAGVVVVGAIVFREPMPLAKASGVIISLSAVTFFLLSNKKKVETMQPTRAFWSGIATVLCITVSILCSIIGTMHTQLSIMHSIWLRLIIALPLVSIVILMNRKLIATTASPKFYGAVAFGVIAQTILGSYLWFYCTYKIGISTFQTLIATLPFFVYAADVYFFKRTKPSLYFIIAAFVALFGIWLVMK